ncbi:hypothetical protein DMUE_0197 [Dictyocoela muelleri]|nr:hypothetical protein DMUE_0197 [Dictyocoela muelleri]
MKKLTKLLLSTRMTLRGLKMIHKINLLKSIEHQDVLTWTHAFKEISRVCNWNTEAQLDVLKHIVSIDIQFKIGAPVIPELYLNLLLKQKYNQEKSYKYYERLSSLKQSNFYIIRKYLREIEINCRKLAICLDWDINLEIQKQQEIFFNGIDPVTKLELSKFFKKDFKSVYESILTTEVMLIENIQHSLLKTKPNTDKHDRFEIKKQNTRDNKLSNKSNLNKKYCSFHKNNTHSTEECRAKKKCKELNSNNAEKILLLQEPNPKIKTTLIPITYKNQKYNAILDTGSEYNYVSEDTIKTIDVSQIKNIPEKPIELANGTTTSVSTCIEDEINIFNDDKMKIRNKFFILKGLNYPFLLGMEFILKNNLILNIQSKTITVDGM